MATARMLFISAHHISCIGCSIALCKTIETASIAMAMDAVFRVLYAGFGSLRYRHRLLLPFPLSRWYSRPDIVQLTWSNTRLVSAPNVDRIPITTTAMRTRISAYSTRPCPRARSVRKRRLDAMIQRADAPTTRPHAILKRSIPFMLLSLDV
jgi:hypothetical protein